MDDGGKAEKPVQRQVPVSQAPESIEQGRTESKRVGVDGVLQERAAAVEQVRYRITGGAQGVGPAAHVAAQRRTIIGEAAARIMRKATGPAGRSEIPNGTGSPLTGDVKAKLEPKLGADLSAVRVHTGADSAQAATNFGARAFTVGNDIHFNSGQFAPGSKEGNKLLAHELTHVVQGQTSAIQRKQDDGADKAGGDEKHDVSDPSEPAEREADAVADDVAGELEENEQKTDDKRQDEKPKKSAASPVAAEKQHAISAKLESNDRIHRASNGQPGKPAANRPPPPPVFDVARIASSQNVRVGNLLDSPGPGHSVLQSLAAGNPDALAPVGVGSLPAGFPSNGVEWGLGQLPNKKCFVIRGGAGAVDWSPFENVTPLAHSHPLRRIQSAGGKTVPQMMDDQTHRHKVFPSDSDLKVMSQKGVKQHQVHTPFRHEAPDKLDNPSGPSDGRPTVTFAMKNIRDSGTLKGFPYRKHACEMTAEAEGRAFWSGPFETSYHPGVGDLFSFGKL